jgi:phage host-nuclease inhibitor protein Gam
MTSSFPSPAPAAPVIQTRPQLEALVENIVELKAQRSELLDAQDAELAGIREKYRLPLAEIERYLTLEMAWAEAWARNHPAALGTTREIECAKATIGFRLTPPRVERASRKWTWHAIALKLAEVGWGQRYLRVPAAEVNKEAILAERGAVSPEELRLAGLKIIEGERFFVAPHGTAEPPGEVEPDWREAA